MINVIIVEDNKFFNDQYVRIVEEIKLKLKVNINVYKFFDYNEDFKKIANKDIPNKIYIFDIIAVSNTGTSVASKIRRYDKNSLIIFITSFYNKFQQQMLNDSLIYFKYIDKNRNYLNILKKTLIKAITEIDLEHIITIETSEINYFINVEDILYIYTYNRTNYIVTPQYDVPCKNRTIKSFIDSLPNNFELSHRSCIVNLKKIDYIDKKNKIIYLKNGLAVDLLSKQNMKNIIDKLNKMILK